MVNDHGDDENDVPDLCLTVILAVIIIIMIMIMIVIMMMMMVFVNQVLSLMGRALFGSLRHSRSAFIIFPTIIIITIIFPAIIVNIFTGIQIIFLATQEDPDCITSPKQQRSGEIYKKSFHRI